MTALLRTVLCDRHAALGAKMVEFGGWQMPLHYPGGILEEHLATRRRAGLFDVSHMGRFVFRGAGALAFLQHALTNNAEALEPGMSQYTLIPNERGGAIDDAYLYRFDEAEYLLVVNAANRRKDWEHFRGLLGRFDKVELEDRTDAIAMISLQGPRSKDILSKAMEDGALPEPARNALGTVTVGGTVVRVARTGYTGEPLCFELFVPTGEAAPLWDRLREGGAEPVGLGARDTLRLEAGLPLYGHELGSDPEGREIPIFAIGLARFAVSFSPLKGAYIGKEALERQFQALAAAIRGRTAAADALPRRVRPLALSGQGIARGGNPVFQGEKRVGFVTSGTMVPYWRREGEGVASTLADETEKRAIALALIDTHLVDGDRLIVDIRGRRAEAVVVPYHLRSEAPPCACPVTYRQLFEKETVELPRAAAQQDACILLERAAANTRWRQQECVNLIPSEQTPSPAVRLLSIMDPVCRYAEHKAIRAFGDLEVFFYQGTDFIAEVERLLERELRTYLGCADVETRLLSGQMANTAVFSAMVDFINRTDRRSEPRRLRPVLNNHILRGGHLSAQPMGALRDFVAHDPVTERPAVVPLPVLPDNPYQADVAACRELIARTRPELIVLGKSMVLHREPVAAVRETIDALGLDCVLMYDTAHVLGLLGPHFQEPFKEGADLVTGSTHKTYFGTQRGIVGANYAPGDAAYPLWEAVRRRAFPGSVSNHHLGTLLGLLMAAYEMNAFKDEYQRRVLANAKGFARALRDCGLDVAGDPAISYTETHQVILNVGYAGGPGLARRLEENNILVNYQATPEEEGLTASGGLRMGVSEMTRFGMDVADFQELAQLIRDVVVGGKTVRDDVAAFRRRFLHLRYCFSGGEFDGLVQRLQQLI